MKLSNRHMVHSYLLTPTVLAVRTQDLPFNTQLNIICESLKRMNQAMKEELSVQKFAVNT